ncbi:hypothetical protein AAH446_16275 [Erwinia sp. P6884]|uniref:hypothetical protein n=1 Tax=Erwinia sp. P6884 TaxID=3141450 RepID=UPI0031982453
MSYLNHLRRLAQFGGLVEIRSEVVTTLIDQLEAANELNKHLDLAVRKAEGCSEALRRRSEAAEKRIAELEEDSHNYAKLAGANAARAQKAEAQLAELAAQEPVAFKKRLVNHRSGVEHHWTYGEKASPSHGDIFRVEVVPLYTRAAPPAPIVVKLPSKEHIPAGCDTQQMTILLTHNAAIDGCAEACAAAGIKLQIEGE